MLFVYAVTNVCINGDVSDSLGKYFYWRQAAEPDLPVNAVTYEKIGKDVNCYEEIRAC